MYMSGAKAEFNIIGVRTSLNSSKNSESWNINVITRNVRISQLVLLHEV